MGVSEKKHSIKQGKISLHGMKYQSRIGCTAEERGFPQPLTVDVDIEADLEAVISTGQLEWGICWEAVNRLLTTQIQEREWVLVEQLADSLGHTILEQFSAADAVQLRIKKYPFVHCEWVGVELRRERS